VAEPFQLTEKDIELVIRSIGEGRVRGLDKVPYDPKLWDIEAVRDWLERNQEPRRARQILSELKNGDTVTSRPMAPTAWFAIHTLLTRIEQLERDVAELKAASKPHLSH
jgi:hypothetical protein